MNKERRKFLGQLGLLSAGTVLSPGLINAKDGLNFGGKPSLKKFGIQLYTLRDDMPKDPKGIITKLASFGYKQLEGFEGDQGMFWNMSHKDFKMFLDDLGLTMISSHCNIRENFEEKAAQAAEIGMDYLICPYIGPQKSVEDWKKVTELFNDRGRICKENGIRFAYHNHEYSFKAFSGMIPHDFIMQNTDPELVDHEMDIYWVITGGADPIDFLTRYPNRFKLCHVKDRIKGSDERGASCDLGDGFIDYPKILKVAADQGMEFYIVEQERYDNSTPLMSAEHDAKYLKKLKFKG